MGREFEEQRILQKLSEMIDEERLKGFELKEKLQQQIRERMKASEDLSFRSKELQDQLDRERSENSALVAHLASIQKELIGHKQDNRQTHKLLEESLRSQEKDVLEQDKLLQSEVNNALRNNFTEIQRIQSEWQQRLDEQLSLYGRLQSAQQHNRLELKQKEEELNSKKIQDEDEMKEIIERTKREQRNIHRIALNQLETRINTITEQLVENQRSLASKLSQFESTVHLNSHKRGNLIEQITAKRIENDDILNKNNQFLNHQEKQAEMLQDRDSIIAELHKELETLATQQLDMDQQVDAILSTQMSEAQMKLANSQNDLETLRTRILDLEKAIRETHSNNFKIANDRKRLSELLAARISQNIAKVFNEHGMT